MFLVFVNLYTRLDADVEFDEVRADLNGLDGGAIGLGRVDLDGLLAAGLDHCEESNNL